MNRQLEYYKVDDIKTLKELISRSSRLYGKNPVFLIKDEKAADYREVTYGKFQEDINAVGTYLCAKGLKGEKIAIIGENCYHWFTAYYSVVNGTGVCVPLDKELNKDEVRNLVERSGAKAVFFTETYKDFFEGTKFDLKVQMDPYQKKEDKREDVLYFQDILKEGFKLLENGDRTFVDAVVDPDKMNMILYTSGTTGKAKGVMLSHFNIVSNILDGSRIVKVRESDRTLSVLPIHHTFESTMGTGLALYYGASIAVCEGLKYIAKNMMESKATILVGVPLIFESIYQKIWKQAEKTGKADALKKAIAINKKAKKLNIDLKKVLFKSIYSKFGGKLRMVVSGAAPIDPVVAKGFEDLGIRALQGYGLTECSPLVAGTPDFSDTYKAAGSVGPCVYSGELKIINKDEQGVGEITFRGPNVMLGYYEMGKETAEVLKDGWFYTGDLGYLDDKGWLYITGRKKNVIVTKTGKNIYPEEVEHYMNRHKYIQESLVYGVDMEDKDTTVGAQVRPDYEVIYEEFGENVDETQVYDLIKKAISDINGKLPIYKRVRNFSLRKEEFIKTTTKKIIRHKN